MRRFLSPLLVAAALLTACDAPSTSNEPRIEVRSASLEDDGSMRLEASLDGHDRQVHIADFDGTRLVAVVDATTDGPLVTLVSEAQPECVTDDAVACELTEAALDGVLDELAADVGDQPVFRRINDACDFFFGPSGEICYVCGGHSPQTCSG